MAAMDISHLRSWTLDESLDNTLGVTTSSSPLLPKTPPPKHWINPTAHSPLASFEVPRSLTSFNRSFHESTPPIPCVNDREHCEICPRTPSPVKRPVNCRPLLDIVKEKMIMGRFLGDIDIMSSRMNDESMQLLLQKCFRLHTLRLVHTCTVKYNDTQEESRIGTEAGNLHKTGCGCGAFSDKAFTDVHNHCPDLASVTLILQHVTFRKTLQKLLGELGRLQKLQTLSVEIRMPSFGQSTKSKFIWESHTRFTEQEISALIKAGPPPLHALGLNRCDLAEASVVALASAFPHIEALDLHSDFENPKQGLPESVPIHLQGLRSLTAAAFGVLNAIERCHFNRWQMPALKRLRLQSREPLCLKHLQHLQMACPQLESLHVIWNTPYGLQEAHIYPFTENKFVGYDTTVFNSSTKS